MMKPKLLDLFCKAGGAAKGYQRAGFYVVGVDNEPQPHYCGDEFYQADALTYPLEGFDAYHASPPCQGYTKLQFVPNRDMSRHPRLIEPTRERLAATGRPYVIENVPQAPLVNSLMLCGTMFGLRTRRHRLFECWPPIYFAPALCNHLDKAKRPGQGGLLAYYTADAAKNMVIVAGHLFSLKAGSVAMDIDWMSRDELAQAIPPAYTEYIGKQLIKYLVKEEE